MKYKLIKVEEYKGNDLLLTLEQSPNVIDWMFGNKKQVKQYYGSPTVFHNYPSCKRCSTDMEIILCDFYEYARTHLIIEDCKNPEVKEK